MRIEKFLSIYPKKGTVKVYQAGLYAFFDCLYGKVRKGNQVTKEEKKVYEELAERYFDEQRNHFDDLLQFAASLHDVAPLGARSKLAGVKEFLGYYDVELTERQRRQLSTKMPKGKTARTAEKDLDTETLRKILTHMDLKSKAVTLTLASSGMRIGELIQVQLSDVDLSATPPEIVVRGEGTKTGDTRIVFVSSEAQEVLQEWLKIREAYLASAQSKNRGLVKNGIGKEKLADDGRLFPFTDVNFRAAWENALRKAELWSRDNSTGRSQLRVHALRKFFRSQLALSCPLDIVEALMGHEGYLTDAYRRFTRKQMGEYYLRAEHHVTVMGSGDIREIQDRLQDTQAAMEGYRSITTKQAEDLVDLKRRMEAMEATMMKINEVDEVFSRVLEDQEVQSLLMAKLKEIMQAK
jgi:integrase